VRCALLHPCFELLQLHARNPPQSLTTAVTVTSRVADLRSRTRSAAPPDLEPWAARLLGWPPELYLLAGGLLVCISIFMLNQGLGIDRFAIPKEFVLALTALSAGLLAATRARSVQIDRIDLCLLGFLVWSTISSFGAVNSWWARRALVLLIVAIVVFWISRSLQERGYRRQLIAVIALSAVPIAIPALLQAYGAMPDISLEHRSPGGTLGNRNSVAHLLVLGLPFFLVYAVRVRRQAHAVMVNLAMAGIAAVLLLSRTRAAWLALIALIGALVVGVWMAPRRVRERFPARAIAVLIVSALIGALAASRLPNRLLWNSSQPYFDTLRGMVDYRSGSGRGRLVQYSTTLKMIRDQPLLGVGPGNWPVRYSQYASPGDPNFSTDIMMNRLHNGDWLGFAAELGLPGALLLILAGYQLLRLAWRRYRSSLALEPDLEALALLAMLPATFVLGLFDSKLHTPAGIFLLCTALGAVVPQGTRRWTFALKGSARLLWSAVVAATLLAPVVFTSRQLWSAHLTLRGAPVGLMHAVELDPGNYRAHRWLARAMADQHQCELAMLHLAGARRLYRSGPDPDWLSTKCPAHAVSTRH
jgi:O-antigen ligase